MIVVAIVLTGANVVGYTKCSKQASAQVRSMARNAMTAGLTVRARRPPLAACCVHFALGVPQVLQYLGHQTPSQLRQLCLGCCRLPCGEYNKV